MTKYQFDATTSRVVPLTDDSPNWGKHFSQADLVIEVGEQGSKEDGGAVWVQREEDLSINAFHTHDRRCLRTWA